MTRYVVEVNEAAVFATRASAAWWAMYRQVNDRIGRITDTVVSLGGNRSEVACDDREHADWLAAHMVERIGLPKSAVRVREVAE